MRKWTGTRKAIHDATYIFIKGKEISAGRSAPGAYRDEKIVDALEAGHILSAIDRQPAPVKSWLWFAYAAYYSKNQQELIHRHAFNYILATRGKITGDFSRIQKTIRACRIAIEDYRLRKSTNGLHCLTVNEMAIVMQCSPAGWHKYWRPVHYLVFDFLEKLDEKGIISVAKEISKRQQHDLDVA